MVCGSGCERRVSLCLGTVGRGNCSLDLRPPHFPPALSTLPDAETPISHCGTVKDGQRGLSSAVVELLLPQPPPPEWWFL